MGATFEVEVSPGRLVVLRELGAQEFVDIVDKVGGIKPDTEMKLAVEGLRKSLVSIAGTALKPFPDLAGDNLVKQFASAREFLVARTAWNQIHLPDEEDQSRVKAMRAVSS